jgi:hypothetical protein
VVFHHTEGWHPSGYTIGGAGYLYWVGTMKTETETGGNMKLKKALVLSLVVNAIFLVAVGYMAVIDIDPESTPPLFIYTTNAPAPQLSSLAVGQ